MLHVVFVAFNFPCVFIFRCRFVMIQGTVPTKAKRRIAPLLLSAPQGEIPKPSDEANHSTPVTSSHKIKKRIAPTLLTQPKD